MRDDTRSTKSASGVPGWVSREKQGCSIRAHTHTHTYTRTKQQQQGCGGTLVFSLALFALGTPLQKCRPSSFARRLSRARRPAPAASCERDRAACPPLLCLDAGPPLTSSRHANVPPLVIVVLCSVGDPGAARAPRTPRVDRRCAGELAA